MNVALHFGNLGLCVKHRHSFKEWENGTVVSRALESNDTISELII